MSILSIKAHEGTNGFTATTGNTGYDSDTGAGTAPTYNSASALIGSTCIEWSGGGSAARQFIANDDARCSATAVQITGTPTNPITFLRKRDAATTALAQCRITTGRLMDLRDGSATVTTSSFALVANTWYQIIFDVDGSGGGTIEIWNASGNTLHERLTGTVGSGAVGDTTCGQFNGSANVVRLDQHVLADVKLGPYVMPQHRQPNQMHAANAAARAVGRSYSWREAASGLLVPVRGLGLV